MKKSGEKREKSPKAALGAGATAGGSASVHRTNGAAPAPLLRSLFGTDGIRGIANEFPMTPELALQLGRAVTFVAGRGKAHSPRILVGKDTRLSGYMLEQAIAG